MFCKSSKKIAQVCSILGVSSFVLFCSSSKGDINRPTALLNSSENASAAVVSKNSAGISTGLQTIDRKKKKEETPKETDLTQNGSMEEAIFDGTKYGRDDKSQILPIRFYLMAKGKDANLKLWFLGDKILLSNEQGQGGLAILNEESFLQETRLKKGAEYCSGTPQALFGNWPKSVWATWNWIPYMHNPVAGRLYEWRRDHWEQKIKSLNSHQFIVRTFGKQYALAMDGINPHGKKPWRFVKLKAPKGFVVPKPTRSKKKGCPYRIVEPGEFYISKGGKIVVVGEHCDDANEDISRYAIERWLPGRKHGRIELTPYQVGEIKETKVISHTSILLFSETVETGQDISAVWHYNGKKWEKLLPLMPFPGNSIVKTLSISKENIWMIRSNHPDNKKSSLWHYNGKEWKKHIDEMNSIILSFLSSNKGEIWILADDGKEMQAWRGRAKTGFSKIEIPDFDTRNVKIDKVGDVWIEAGESIYRSKPPKKALKWKDYRCKSYRKRKKGGEQKEDWGKDLRIPSYMRDDGVVTEKK